MQRSTRWILGVVLFLLIAVIAAVLVPTLAERHAVARLLEAGASVAFESSKRDNELVGNYSSFDHDSRSLFSYWQSDADIVNRNSATPAGLVWWVNLKTNRAVQVLLEDAWAYDHAEGFLLEEALSDSEAASLFAAIAGGDFPATTSIDCYAKLKRQSTLDSLLQLPIKSLLIGCPEMLQCDLSKLNEAPNLKTLWINEGEYGCEGCENAARYDEQDFKAIALVKQLKHVVLIGLNITNGMADQLAGAAQLEKLSLSRCQISDTASDKLRKALPYTIIKITTPANNDDAASE